MLKFQEIAKHATVARFNSACSDAVIARRYTIQKKLGNGSFGSVYLVTDRKAKQGEKFKSQFLNFFLTCLNLNKSQQFNW
uniref:Uncharacterized protein n=1 Tax=Malurus cyaneus samueli TaxID=2593467 RepID=A0A8C5TA37_9PASS